MDENLIFSESASIKFASNTFIDVPIILQYEDIPLIEVLKTTQTSRTTQLPIYGRDGTYLAKVVGTRIFATKEGEKAGLSLRYPKNMTVCELNGKTVFEIRREGPSSLSIAAELFTQDGSFIRAPSDLLPQLLISGSSKEMRIGGLVMINCTIMHSRIGILIKKNGAGAIGVS